jgi:Zn-finger nucleic acid-binding protein
MVCPTCQQTLLMTDRQGVEIDYCPKCRGIWLDRGELEKLIEKSVAVSDSIPRRVDRQGYIEHDDYRERRESSSYTGKYKKRESWLSRILDFD